MSYEITCICGQALRGEREPRHKIVDCPGCARKSLIFPKSPFDLPVHSHAANPSHSWRAPLIAAGVSVLLLLVGFAIALPYLTRPTTPPDAKRELSDPQTIVLKMASAREALAQGKFHVALRLCNDAIAGRRQWPDQLTPEESRDLTHLHRQAQLFAQLLPKPLEDIVRHAKLVRDPDEWAAQFADYKGRGVVFDDSVKLDNEGRPTLANHVIEVEETIVRVALEDVTLLRTLPLEEGPRLIFGVRLARCTQEEGGVWVIRLEANSGVLLTEQAAVEACFPVKVENLAETLDRQRRWQEQNPGEQRLRRERE